MQRHSGRRQALAVVLALVKEHGMTREDDFPLRTSAAAVAAFHGVDGRTLRRGRQAPKYRDAATGTTWSGLGRAPRWLAGVDRARFLIGALALGADPTAQTSAGSMISAVLAQQQAPTLPERPIIPRPMSANKPPQRTPASPPAGPVHLTPAESEWLVKLATTRDKRLSLLVDKPPARAMNGLVRKGMATDIMGTFWELTEQGQQRCAWIY